MIEIKVWKNVEKTSPRFPGPPSYCIMRLYQTVSSSNWGIIDMLGGGLLTTMVKHSKMDDAAADLNEARDALQRFSRELQDVHSFVDFPFNTADFLSFADFFFDGFIADWLMQDRINAARDQVSEAKQRVNAIRSQLSQMVQ